MSIEVRRLTRTYRGDVRALDEVTLDIRDGTITGLLGRNGTGKTTLMSIMTGQELPTRGTVHVLGQDPLENEAVLGQMCFIRESQVYPNNYRLSHVLAAGPAFYPNWSDDIAGALVEQFGLPLKREVNKMSRGMRSSVGILIGLASQAPITFFDEPYLGLDATARQQFYDMLLADYGENPRTIVLSTHLIDEVSRLLEDVIVLDRGRVVLQGPAEEVARSFCTVTGPVADVERFASGRRVVHREALGAYLALTLDLPFDPAVRRLAEEYGIEANPVSLQNLVVHAASVGRTAQEAAR